MCHVLIIEDDALIAMDLQAILEIEGASSFSFAVSEQEAVREALVCRPALITSDFTLVEGTGPLAVAAIRQALGPIPVIFISGTPEACPAGEAACLTLGKPVDHTAIVRAFQKLLPEARAPGS